KADFPSEGPQDPRWHWAAPLLLDRGDPTLRTLLEEWINEGHEDEDGETEDSSVRGSEALLAHRKEALKLLDGELKLGAVPDSLADTLALLALGSPANVVARALRRPDVSPIARRKAAVQVAGGFRTLFNQPQIIRMLRGAVDDGDESYWETTLSYAVKGNLQAVIDEQVHLLWEQYAWDDKAADALCESVARALTDSVTMKVSRIQPDIYSPGARRIEAMDAGDAGGTRERVSMRTSFALRYGTVKGDSGTTEAREESVRTAFKSPFFPFVLVSTSVGQEGLDFHPWCHDIWHWNLPGNPVDLEQREGRVHRYKGLAVIAGGFRIGDGGLAPNSIEVQRGPARGERGLGLTGHSSGAPEISRGVRQVLPVKRRMVARSTRRSTVAMAWASEGKRFFHWVKPVFAVRMMEPWP
nr:hypothetical protein [Gemmatimonadales bacterium]